ncbi:Hypothetical protein SRAE_1000160200 [Strongyloides ratti]|uniref:Uncharacterized protein n=1 Tax=Strongyloides ratti TaxID=34506 RepID=A0A090L0N8_STRRB|nr:Hypothetical protein SRAE_1000160200 [Strongyloides ratti]CEF63340.1 Hypothetical protein SRAE_1000160200 [Strongyloides ratti]
MSTKTGFRIQFDHQFFFNELNEKYQSEVAITAYPLSDLTNVSTSLYFPEIDSKLNNVGLVDNCLPDTWYYLCTEFSSLYREKKVIGNECGIYKTLSNTGDLVTSTLKKIDLINIGLDQIIFTIFTDTTFPIEYNFFLENQNVSYSYLTITEAYTFFAFKKSSFNITFTKLQSRFNYGKLCVLEKPLISGITIQGRSINSGSIFIKNCHFDSLQTTDYTLEQQASNCLDENKFCSANSSTHLKIFKIILLWFIQFIIYVKEYNFDKNMLNPKEPINKQRKLIYSAKDIPKWNISLLLGFQVRVAMY